MKDNQIQVFQAMPFTALYIKHSLAACATSITMNKIVNSM
jgi:hypothetical protein